MKYSINKKGAVVIDDGSGKTETINRKCLVDALSDISECLAADFNFEYYRAQLARYANALEFLDTEEVQDGQAS